MRYPAASSRLSLVVNSSRIVMGALAIICIFLAAAPSHAMVLGTVGRTYAIAEKDAVSELEERALHMDWKLMYSRIRPENYRPKDLKDIPRALKPGSFLVDMTYTLDSDIPDGKGGVLYPAGFTFNPLDYVPFDKTLVVIDGTDKGQVSWFAASRYRKKPDVMLLITSGPAFSLQKQLKQPVFYSTRAIVQRFGITVVPSVIRRRGRLMEVVEICLDNHGRDNRQEAGGE
jgi:conjugal transfer pilus assembly protein TraW